MNKRPYLLGSLALAVLAWLAPPQILPGLFGLLVQLGSIVLLGIYAWHWSDAQPARLVAAAAMLSAASMLFWTISGQIAQLLFLAALFCTLGLFLQERRTSLSELDKGVATVLTIGPAVLAMLFGGLEPAIAALLIGGVSAAAWAGNFPRWRVVPGALMLVIAYLLPFILPVTIETARTYALLHWPLVYVGHFMIATGVVQRYIRDRPRAA
ncbi:hypothetical protein [Alteripontixanthobacter maritimus]|nr:hypothetical protein [Alteripontixanthobacter maritimus]